MTLKATIFTVIAILYLSSCVLTQGKLSDEEKAEQSRQVNEEGRIAAEQQRVEAEVTRAASHSQMIGDLSSSQKQLSEKSDEYKQKVDGLVENTKATQQTITEVERDTDSLDSEIKDFQANPTDEITEKAKSEQLRLKNIVDTDQKAYDSVVAQDSQRFKELQDSNLGGEAKFDMSLEKTQDDMKTVQGHLDSFKVEADKQIETAEELSTKANEHLKKIKSNKETIEADIKAIQANAKKQMGENKKPLTDEIVKEADQKLNKFHDSEVAKYDKQSQDLKEQLKTQESDLTQIISETKDLSPKIDQQQEKSSEIVTKEIESQTKQISDIQKRFQKAKDTILKQKETINALQQKLNEQKKTIDEHQKHLNTTPETPTKEDKKDEKAKDEKVKKEQVESNLFGNLVLTVAILSVLTIFIASLLVCKLMFPSKKITINFKETSELNDDIEQAHHKLKLFDF